MKIPSKRYILVFLVSVSFIFGAYSQSDSLNYIGQYQLIFKEGSKYTYDFQTYKYKDLRSILETHPESLEYYNKTLIKKQLAKRTTIMLIASSSSTVLFYWLAKRADNGSGSFFQLAITGGLTMAVSLVLIPINISQHTLKKRYRIKSIQSFNEQKILENGFKKDLSYLQLGITRNGVGLVFSF